MIDDQTMSLVREARTLLRAGDRASARRLFIEAIKANPRDASLWLELSQAARDAEEEQRCLDEALKRDPANPLILAMQTSRAQQVAATQPAAQPPTPQIRHLGPRPQPEPAPQPAAPVSGAEPAPQGLRKRFGVTTPAPWPAVAPATPERAAVDPLGTLDPWANDPPDGVRCPYCATPEPGQERCRHCRRKLVMRVFKPRSMALYVLCGFLMIWGLLNLLILLGAYLVAQELGTSVGEQLPSGETLGAAGKIALGVYVGFFVVGASSPFVIGLGILLRQVWAWFIGTFFAALNLVVTVLMLLLLLREGVFPLLLLPGLIMPLGMLLLFLHVSDQVMGTRASIGRLPSKLPSSSNGFFLAGKDYSSQGMWYLAARMWQRAVNLEHRNYGYRRALGAAYLEVGALEAAELELRAADQLTPGDQLTRELLEKLQRQAQR